MSGGNIKVVVRCRPLNLRELARGAKGLIRMEGSQTIIEPPQVDDTHASSRSAGKKPQIFSFDKSYWSAGKRDDSDYASQKTLYDDLGVELLDHSFEGFNTCIFAYGQTGSGKSYSMMGYGADKGIIPLTTSELFRRVETRSAAEKDLSYSVEVSYIEIYNEKVRDLLNPKNKDNLRVREHPSLGPYVEDLSRLVVEDYSQMMTLMDEGNKARTVASTNMNETSSRSHAVFTVILTQKRLDPITNMVGEKVSKISLVDLAGSERQASTGATGARLREGSNINKSLTTLGKVIAALAQASETIKGKKKKDDFVPYRDSILTWLLKESLGGNSKTAMIAAISRGNLELSSLNAARNISLTSSTLRYADAAKRIKTHAVVNEDPNAKLIRELKEELELLRSRVSGNTGNDEESTYDPSVPADKQIVRYRTKDGEIKQVTKLELQDQLQASEKLMESLNLTWEEKMAKTAAIHIEREKALEELGISIDKDVVGVHAPQKHPSLVNLNEDPLMSECLIYQLKPGITIAGATTGETAHVRLSGSHILDTHCIFTNTDGKVTVEALADARTFVNGKRVPPNSPIKLLNGYRVILGDFHVFRYNDPQAVRLERQRLSGTPRSDSPSKLNDEFMDWTAARREVADIEKLGDQDLDKLYDDIVKVRIQRRKTDSRMDLAAEFESRLTGSQTDELPEPVGNPWAGPMETTTTERESLHTPNGDDDPSYQDHRSDNSLLGPAIKLIPSEDSTLEQEHLTRQLKSLALEVKRIRSQAAASRALDKDIIDTATWSAKELKFVQGAIKKWRGLRAFKMAEQILMGAVDVKEANVVAHAMGRKVSYNFLIGDDGSGHPSSSRDGLGQVADLEDVGESLYQAHGPGVLIKVLDREANAIYTWDFTRFHQQLVKMRHVRALKQRPNYSLHFRDEGTFTNPAPPSYAFIGTAKAPLRLLANRISHDLTLPIICPYTMEAIGSCRLTFALSSSGSSGVASPESVSRPLKGTVPIGQRYSFDILLNGVKGISSSSFSSIHAQVRLSSLIGEDIASDDTFISPSTDLTKSSASHLSLRKTVTILVTPAMVEYMKTGYADFEFYATLRPQYLERLERWDISRETSIPQIQSPGGRPPMRRCETDFLGEEHHDVLATITVSELSSSGTYEPVEVIDDIYQLHQGVQRRLVFKLHHSSGKSFQWTSIDHVTVGDIRTRSKDQITTVSEQDVDLKVTSNEVDDLPDGTSTLSASGPWDTAAHGSIHLDRRTRSEQTIIVRLVFLVNVESLHEPASFTLDLPLKILARESRRSSLMSYFTSATTHKSLTAIYGIDLVPPIAQSSSDLWRLDTAKKHVPGEEGLGDWKPRGVSLFEDWQRATKTAKGIADKQVTSTVLDLLGDLNQVEVDGHSDDLVRKSLKLWEQHMNQRYLINLEPREDEAISRKLRKLMPELETKLVPHVKLAPKVDTIIKEGTMAILRDSQANKWDKCHFILRRPYLHIHPTYTERPIQIINLTKANLTPSPDVEALLGHRFAFTIFTPNNSYVLQAPNAKELNEWMRVIITSAG